MAPVAPLPAGWVAFIEKLIAELPPCKLIILDVFELADGTVETMPRGLNWTIPEGAKFWTVHLSINGAHTEGYELLGIHEHCVVYRTLLHDNAKPWFQTVPCGGAVDG